jgi:hypothetical protein
MQSRTTINRKGARVSPCRTPAVGVNGSVGPSGVFTVAEWSWYRLMMAVMRIGGT